MDKYGLQISDKLIEKSMEKIDKTKIIVLDP